MEPMKLRNIHANVWIGGVLIILSAIFYGMAGKFVNPSAAVWPRAVLVGIILLSALLVLNGVKQTAAHADPGLIPLDIIKGPMAALLVIVVYTVLMKFTGYFVSTAIFLPFGMFALGQRNWKAILGVTVGLELFVYVLFVMQLQLRMP